MAICTICQRGPLAFADSRFCAAHDSPSRADLKALYPTVTSGRPVARFLDEDDLTAADALAMVAEQDSWR